MAETPAPAAPVYRSQEAPAPFQEKRRRRKKPFFLRWWFIVIVIIAAVCVIGHMGKGSKDAKNDHIPALSDSSERDAAVETAGPALADTPSPEPEESEETENDGISSGFKEAMDSYEAFMDEYITFMKKFQSSDGTDLSLLADYASYMSKYAEMVEEFDNWDDEEMSTAEAAYYIDVQSRVTKKLLEITG